MGGRENAASAVAMWIWNVGGFHYYMTTDGINDSAWANPNTNGFGDNGDGFIWYAGKPTGTYGIGGTKGIPLESLRMKLWRYGLYVVEYAKLLRAAGKNTVADAQIANMLTLSTDVGNTWGSVAAWEAARETMANEILGTSDTTPPSAPTGIRVQ